MIWQTLEQSKEEVGPLAKLQAMWRELPAPKGNQPDVAREGCVRMRDFVVKIRRHTEKLFTNAEAPGLQRQLSADRNVQEPAARGSPPGLRPSALRVEGEPPPAGLGVDSRTHVRADQEAAALKIAVAAYIKERQEDPDLVVPGRRARPL